MLCETCASQIAEGERPRCPLCRSWIECIQEADPGDIEMQEPQVISALQMLRWLRGGDADHTSNIFGQYFPYWIIPDESVESPSVYIHPQARLPGRKRGLLLDTGAAGNRIGANMAKAQSEDASKYGLESTQRRRDKPISVAGLGHGTQTCTHDVDLPIATVTTDGNGYQDIFTVPAIDDTDGDDLQGLLGLVIMRRKKMIIDVGGEYPTYQDLVDAK